MCASLILYSGRRPTVGANQGRIGCETSGVPDQDPPTPHLVDIARLLNVSKERARQIANGEDYRFPAPAIAGPRRAWSRDDLEDWMDEVQWWESKPWRKPAE